MLFDSHTHLESRRFDGDREAVIRRAQEAAVMRMITCGSDLESSRQCLALAGAHDGVLSAVGIHPHEAKSALCGDPDAGEVSLAEAAFEELAELASHRSVVALGEMGLDYHYDFSPRPAQRAVLARHLALAAELDLPVIMHNRESDTDFRRVIEAGPRGLRGVLHCFLADQEMADWALARDLYLGIAGPITFRNVTHLDEIVRRMCRERLLIETDCPYLAPQPRRGRRNEPAYVQYVAEHVAGVWGTSVEDVAQQTTANANRLFGLE
jgi:TatD DNase family protein